MLSVEYMVMNFKTLESAFIASDELDKRGRLKLESMGIKIDRLIPAAKKVMGGWSRERRKPVLSSRFSVFRGAAFAAPLCLSLRASEKRDFWSCRSLSRNPKLDTTGDSHPSKSEVD